MGINPAQLSKWPNPWRLVISIAILFIGILLGANLDSGGWMVPSGVYDVLEEAGANGGDIHLAQKQIHREFAGPGGGMNRTKETYVFELDESFDSVSASFAQRGWHPLTGSLGSLTYTRGTGAFGLHDVNVNLYPPETLLERKKGPVVVSVSFWK